MERTARKPCLPAAIGVNALKRPKHPVPVERELESRQIKFMLRVPRLVERYYALAARKRFGNVWPGGIVEAFRARLEVLGSAPRRRLAAD